MPTSSAEQLMQRVVDGGYCIGCGLCAAVSPAVEMHLDELGAYQARLAVPAFDPPEEFALLEVCPFSDEGPDENAIGAARFGDAPRTPEIGHYRGTFAGHVAEQGYRQRGSSGGIARWLLSELLRTGEVDRVIHVRTAEQPGSGRALFEYAVESDVDGVTGGSRAAYAPVEMSGVVAVLRSSPGRYAVTGVPCFVKGLRRLAALDPVVDGRLVATVGIICGHLKTAAYGESLGWQLGVAPDDLAEVDFRTKIPGRRAAEKGVTAFDQDGRSYGPRVVQELAGTKYQEGFFKYAACGFCDDVVAETADVAVGDAWLPGYGNAGNSVVVVRDPRLLAMVERGCEEGRLALDVISPEQVARSQKGGLRDRREGLAYRMHLAERRGRSYPHKRVAPSSDMSLERRALYRLRTVIARRSGEEFLRARRKHDLEGFLRRMRLWTELYAAVERLEQRHLRLRGRVGRLRRRVLPTGTGR